MAAESVAMQKPAVPHLEVVEEKKQSGHPLEQAASVQHPAQQAPPAPVSQQREQKDEKTAEEQETSWETDVGSFRIRIVVPSNIMRQAESSSPDVRTKIAGSIAAQTLQKYPQLAFSASNDPVVLWSDIRKSILTVMERHTKTAVAG
jgi:hypothetical protein